MSRKFDAICRQYAVKDAAGDGRAEWPDGLKSGFPAVKLLGKTFQQTYEGKNLCPVNSLTAEENKDGDIAVPYSGNSVITLSADITKYSDDTATNTRMSVTFYYTDGTSYYASGVYETDGTERDGVTRKKILSVTPNEIKTVDHLLVRVLDYSSTSTRNAKAENIQVEVGSVATAYEPYVGGVPAPNPDYPQDVIANNAAVKSTDADESYDGGTATAPALYAVGKYQDEWNPQTGTGIRRCGVIESYAGETITTPYISTTGELSEGARVIYGIPDAPFEDAPMPLTCPTGYGQIIQVGGDIADCPIEVKYLTHGGNKA